MSEVDEILDQGVWTHGDFADVAGVDQALKEAVRRGRNWGKLSASHRAAIEMIVHKIARVLAGDPDEPDHFLDIQGYAGLVLRDIRRRKSEVQVEPVDRIVPRRDARQNT